MSAITIETQLLNRVLDEKDITIFSKHNIGEEFFEIHTDVFNFINKHYQKYYTVPDYLTVRDLYDNFDNVEVNEKTSFLVRSLKENYMHKQMVPIIEQAVALHSTDSIKSAEFLLAEIDNLKEKCNIEDITAKCIITGAEERLADYGERKERQGLMGISTGIPELDEFTNGMLPEDLMTIVGRTNEGKSWVLQYLLVKAWEQGKKVLMYSGEMGHLVVGYRFDTLHGNVQNSSLMNGRAIHKPDEKKVERDYGEYINELIKTKESKSDFLVITPRDMQGRELDTRMLETMIKTYKPDIIGIDQISLMQDHRKEKEKRIQLANITKDLYALSEVYQIPILEVAQASRKASEAKKKDDNSSPEVDHIADSDDIARNSTRILSIMKKDGVLKICVKKNRYGRVGQETCLLWDIDFGILKPMREMTRKNAKGETKTEEVKKENFVKKDFSF